MNPMRNIKRMLAVAVLAGLLGLAAGCDESAQSAMIRLSPGQSARVAGNALGKDVQRASLWRHWHW